MKPKKLLSFILATVMAISLLPTFTITASAATATTEKNITLGTSALSGYDSTNGYDYIYYGTYNNSPVKWRILDAKTNMASDGLFLLSDVLLGTGNYGSMYFQQDYHYIDGSGRYHKDNAPSDNNHTNCQLMNAWQGSDAQSWCNNFYKNNLTTQEQSMVLATTKSDTAFTSSTYSVPFVASANILSDDKVFFLSAEEAENGNYGFTDDSARIADYGNNAEAWWLRSPHAESTVDIVGAVSIRGNVGRAFAGDAICAARPAFNLDSSKIIFTSAAKGEKKINAYPAGTTSPNGTNTTGEYKLTILDTDRDFKVTQTTASGTKGETITLDYKNVKTGLNEYVSAMIVDKNGEVLYYGQGKKTETSNNSDGTVNGTVQFTLPDEIANEKYTLYVFNEQINGDYKTDYSSAFAKVNLSVGKTTPPDLDLTVPNPTLPKGCEWDNKTDDGILTLNNVTLGTIKLPEFDMDSKPTYSVIKIKISGEVTVDSVIGTKLNTLRFIGEDNNSKLIVNHSISCNSIIGNVVFDSITATVGNILCSSTNGDYPVGLTSLDGSKVTITGNNNNDNVFYSKDVHIEGTSSFTLDGAKIGFSTSSALEKIIGYLQDDTGYSAYEDNGIYYLYYNGNPVTKDTFYYYYVVAFDANGGLPALVEQRVLYANNPVKPADPIRNGYIFKGWYWQNDVEGYEVLFDFDSSLREFNYNMVKANWERDTNAKTINKVIPLTAPVKNAVPLRNIETTEYKATVFWSPEIADGDTFAENTEYTATITITTKENYTTADIGENEYEVNGADSVTNEAESNIVKAVFPKTEGSSGGGGSTPRYTIKFNTDGGNTITSQTVKKNTKATEPTEPTKEGYIFDGWYSDSKLTTEYDFDTKVTKNITLYAKWVEDEVKEPIDDKKDDNKDDEQKPSSNEWKNPFTDVSEFDWFFYDVKYANENSLMSGTTNTTFAPNETLTRGMLVTILYRMAGEPAVNKSIPFADVTADSYYANAVIWAQQNGIVSGVSENEFAPDENITREQIAVILYRYAKVMGYDVSVGEDTNILSYNDFDEISEYAIEAVQYAVGSGLMNGKTESTLNPKDNATRAEIAAILNRFIETNK